MIETWHYKGKSQSTMEIKLEEKMDFNHEGEKRNESQSNTTAIGTFALHNGRPRFALRHFR